MVDGTYYSPLQEDIDALDIDLNIEGWFDVQTAIQEAATRISSKYDLPRFFKRVREVGIIAPQAERKTRYDTLNQRTDRWPKQWDLQETPLPALVPTDELLPCPSVRLGEIRVCDDIPCVIHLDFATEEEQEMEPPEELRERKKMLKLKDRLLEAGLESVSVKGVATSVLIASLELLPVGRQNIVTPILSLTSRTYIASDEEFTQLARFDVQWGVETDFGMFDGPIERGNNHFESYDFAASDRKSHSLVELSLKAEFEADLGAAYHDSLHARSALDRSWVGRFDDWARRCLSTPAFTNMNIPLFQSYCWDTASAMNRKIRRKDRYKDLDPDALAFFPGHTMAALLDRSLFHAPEAASLDYLLEEKTRLLTRNLEARIEKARTRRRERLDELRRE